MIAPERLAAIEAHQAAMERAHRMSCSDPDDPARKTTYGDSAAAIGDLLALVREQRSQLEEAEAEKHVVWDLGVIHGHNTEGRLIDKRDANPYPASPAELLDAPIIQPTRDDLVIQVREQQGDLDSLREASAAERKHWEAWDAYANSGNLDNHHAKVFHGYVDGNVSREYMLHVLSSGPAPCEHDLDYGFGDPARPACVHCNRAALPAEVNQ